MLLYLNKDTWVEQGRVLEHDVVSTHNFGGLLHRMASNLNDLGIGQHAGEPEIKIVIAHENDMEKGGCEFAHFFGTIPLSHTV